MACGIFTLIKNNRNDNWNEISIPWITCKLDKEFFINYYKVDYYKVDARILYHKGYYHKFITTFIKNQYDDPILIHSKIYNFQYLDDLDRLRPIIKHKHKIGSVDDRGFDESLYFKMKYERSKFRYKICKMFGYDIYSEKNKTYEFKKCRIK